MTPEIFVIAVIRIAASLPVLRWPLAGGVLAILADLSDLLLRDALDLGGVGDYQSLDKWLDQVYLATFLIVALRWAGPARSIAVALYAFRFVGFVLFELTGERMLLLVFPNVFEFWFLLVAAVGPARVADWSRCSAGSCAARPDGREGGAGMGDPWRPPLRWDQLARVPGPRSPDPDRRLIAPPWGTMRAGARRERRRAEPCRGARLAEIGTIFGGRYRLVELLGQGGMATIFRALDTQLGREVAVKLLRPEYLRDPDFSSRFRQEAQNAASLSHPNVVTVYDYGEDPAGPFIVMEYVDGEDLASILRRNGALPPTQAARIAAGVARALAASHARGIVHRDVKPGNVLIARDGRVKVVDFGIARAIAEAQMTMPGTTLGSVHYFSPEQARGEPATSESDIYSLGIVLYEMLTGSRPWEGDSAAAVAVARLSGPIPDPALVRGSIPPDLAAITRKALARLPSDRFASAAAMADALESSQSAAGAAAAVGGAAAAGAVARSNPTVVSYPPDAYAGSDDARAAGAVPVAARVEPRARRGAGRHEPRRVDRRDHRHRTAGGRRLPRLPVAVRSVDERADGGRSPAVRRDPDRRRDP